ncbi:Protein MCM10 [Gossypium australe]|uniref:Protein MCM10 n=1 Tax=Gossypium australe TaxID=47621 RepID=A0A5B6W8B2_9ROSI|nr:Protein MCM10 [Gossypium australe]
MDLDPDRAAVDDAASNASAPEEGATREESRPETMANPNAQPLPPPLIPQPAPVAPQVVEVVRRERPPVDKIQKQGAEEFRASKDNDPERAEFWLENTISVFDELSYTPDECMMCVVSLLRGSTYQWWNTLLFVVPREGVNWEFFQEEFQKKYISQRFIDQKRKEFLELK